ncbi:MAG TPA: helix-turn-helix transcriptional regulator [Candidatus Acidoferrales bacterium]|nr:helix-turn-helix transcriptional regulator [Candidatus Acidoferrales bacterium]
MATVSTLPKLDADAIRRRELGDFLRHRRERIAPEQIGLPPSRRRRTPGLRREEVALLAGVGVTWYTWLEQGRDIHASPQVLDAIARTLLFDAPERAHLYTLAGATDTRPAVDCSSITPATQLVLDKLEPFPSLAVNGRYDLLAYNRVWASGFPEFEQVAPEDRNCLWLMFTNPAWRKTILDWDDTAARMVAQFRAGMAEHVAEPAWKELVARLRKASPEFAAFWERHEVQPPENRVKRVRHPDVGLLKLEYTYLWLGQRIGTRIVTYSPVDEETRKRLDRLQVLLDERAAAAA